MLHTSPLASSCLQEMVIRVDKIFGGRSKEKRKMKVGGALGCCRCVCWSGLLRPVASISPLAVESLLSRAPPAFVLAAHATPLADVLSMAAAWRRSARRGR